MTNKARMSVIPHRRDRGGGQTRRGGRVRRS